MDRTTYTLKKPIEIDGEKITELQFRELKAGDLRGISLYQPTAGDLIDLAGKLCGRAPQVMNEVGPADILGIGNLVMDFLPDGLAIGGAR